MPGCPISRTCRCLILSVVIVAPSFVPPGAFAEQPAGHDVVGGAAVPYEAVVRTVVGGHSYSGRIRHSPGMQRHEFRVVGRPIIRIVRFDRGVVWTLDPARRRYTEDALSEVAADIGVLERDRIRLTRRETTVLSGRRATRHAFGGTLPHGGPVTGVLWLSDDGVLLAVEGTSRRAGQRYAFRYRLHDLQIGPQPASLFTVPPGYDREERRPVWGIEASTARPFGVNPGRAGEESPARPRARQRDARPSGSAAEDDPTSLESLFRNDP